MREQMSVCACTYSCINNCVASIKYFIGFLSELLQVVPLFNTRLWAACRGHGGATHWCLTSTLNPSRPCYTQRKERLFPSSDMAQEGSQARVSRGGDSIINEPVWPIGSITVCTLGKDDSVQIKLEGRHEAIQEI